MSGVCILNSDVQLKIIYMVDGGCIWTGLVCGHGQSKEAVQVTTSLRLLGLLLWSSNYL